MKVQPYQLFFDIHLGYCVTVLVILIYGVSSLRGDVFGKDILVIGALAGIMAKVVHGILGHATILVWPTYLNCVRIAAGLLLTPDQVMQGGFGPILLGVQIDFVVGIVIGIVTVLILDKWGYDLYLVKGAMVGLVSWALLYVVLSRLLSQVHPVGSLLYAQIAFFTHLVFGISITQSIVWLSQLFKRRQQ